MSAGHTNSLHYQMMLRPSDAESLSAALEKLFKVARVRSGLEIPIAFSIEAVIKKLEDLQSADYQNRETARRLDLSVDTNSDEASLVANRIQTACVIRGLK